MQKTILISILGVVLILGGAAFVFYRANQNNLNPNNNNNNNNNNNGVVCTMEAKLCPDGSYVGRQGPKCEFAECPKVSTASTSTKESKSMGYVTGTVTLSPTCPVERIPPDPSCSPKPFSTTFNISSSNFFKQIKSNSVGVFGVYLAPGTYTITESASKIYPRCQPIEVKVKLNSTTTADISCDTGIR